MTDNSNSTPQDENLQAPQENTPEPPEHIDLEGICKRLAMARKEAGLSQGQAARLLGWETGAAVSHIETGNRRLTMSVFLHMCAAYGVSTTWALTGINPFFDPRKIIEAIGEAHPALSKILDVLEMMASAPDNYS